MAEENKQEKIRNMRKKKGHRGYKFVIIACIILIVISLCILFRVDKYINPYGLEVIESVFSKDEEITEKQARKIAEEQFEKLGENVNKNMLEVVELKRNDDLYYYVSSEKNTCEISKKGGKITRINAIPTNEI